MDRQLLPHHLRVVKKRIVLFDFDGTITTKDTLLEFIRFYRGDFALITGFLINAPWLVLMKLKLIKNWEAKQKILKWFFEGEDINTFNSKCEEFTTKVVPALIRPKALEEIRAHQNANATVVVVSASAENWVAPWCASLNLNCMATRLEVKDNKLTGRITGANCYGPEKERRIRECFNLSEYEEIYAYGDSSGDSEMIALATNKHYKPFRV